MLKKACILILCALLLPAFPALSEEDAQVVATFYPIYAMAANLLSGAQGVTLTSLTPPTTGCLHDQALMPSDVKALAQADLLLLNGAGMEAYLFGALEQLPELSVVDASQGIALLKNEEHEEHEEHDHGEYNAHLWMSVPNAEQMVRNLAVGLIAALPDQEALITANRDAYLARLDMLDAAIREALAPYQGRRIVTFHEAFAYFAEEYGLTVAATLVQDAEDQLSAGDMARLCKLIVSLDLPPLFTEPAYDFPAAGLIAKETGSKVYALDPATTGTLTAPAVLTAYEDALYQDVRVLCEALSGK